MNINFTFLCAGLLIFSEYAGSGNSTQEKYKKATQNAAQAASHVIPSETQIYPDKANEKNNWTSPYLASSQITEHGQTGPSVLYNVAQNQGQHAQVTAVVTSNARRETPISTWSSDYMPYPKKRKKIKKALAPLTFEYSLIEKENPYASTLLCDALEYSDVAAVKAYLNHGAQPSMAPYTIYDFTIADAISLLEPIRQQLAQLSFDADCAYKLNADILEFEDGTINPRTFYACYKKTYFNKIYAALKKEKAILQTVELMLESTCKDQSAIKAFKSYRALDELTQRLCEQKIKEGSLKSAFWQRSVLKYNRDLKSKIDAQLTQNHTK